MGLAAKHAAVYEALFAAGLDVDRVLDHEPTALPPGGMTLTVSAILPDAVGANDWRIAVRVYIPGNLDPRTSQARLMSVMDNTIRHLPAEFGPDRWSAVWDNDIGAHIAECIIETPRAFGD